MPLHSNFKFFLLKTGPNFSFSKFRIQASEKTIKCSMKTLVFGLSKLTAAMLGNSFDLFYNKFGLIAEYFLLKKPIND